MKRTLLTVTLWTSLVMALACVSLLVIGQYQPGWYTRGGFAAGVTGSRVELAWTNGQISRQGDGLGHPGA